MAINKEFDEDLDLIAHAPFHDCCIYCMAKERADALLEFMKKRECPNFYEPAG